MFDDEYISVNRHATSIYKKNNKNINENNVNSNPADTIWNNNEIINSNSNDVIHDKDVNIDDEDRSIALDLDHIS